MEKLIITVAPVGSVPRKKDTPHIPITTQEIIDDALRCEDAGAALVHIHVRDAEERSSDDPKLFAEVVETLRERSRLIIQISTGGRAGTNLDSRAQRLDCKPEMASLTTGTVNFPDFVFMNPLDVIEGLAAKMQRLAVKPEMEIFDVAMIQNAINLYNKGLVAGPMHFDFVMGIPGAIPASVDHMVHMLRCLPPGSTWTASGIGRAQLPVNTHAILMGGHVRVGLEDNIYYRKGVLATNAQLVERMVKFATEFGREVATPDEARVMLGLPSR
ncbi:BKACE family enzyme [Shumkonia mesophila]|uniref:3-keto-5-aminohexanoate cleavage protein n=1 Tax=Shumkonia mesophila TaxID=2838854 RepID=UPI00293449A3|nr:3-keto-5-aminohexanoate cleavage protein [Shumkonia mesophila]